MSKSHKINHNNSGRALPSADSREVLQWFVNNYALYLGSTRGIFFSDWGDEQAVALEASVINLKSRGFSPFVISGEAIYKQAEFMWAEARSKATFGRPLASKAELEIAGAEILFVDMLEAPQLAAHLWYLMTYVVYPRAVAGKATIFTTGLAYQEFVRQGHECPDPDFGGRPISWEKLIWLLEASTINQELFKLAREESVPPMLKAEYYLYMALRDRGLELMPQHVLGDYMLDFVLVDKERKLNVEVDTISAISGHALQTKEAQRDLVLLSDGWQLLKFSTSEILNNRSACADVVEDIWRTGRKRLPVGRLFNGKNMNPAAELPVEDEAQTAAITAPGGPVVVSGGAGTGKTMTLVHRTAYLLSKGIAPESIVLITFSAETARALRTLLESFIDKAVLARLSIFYWQEIGTKILKENLPTIRRKPPLKIEPSPQKIIQRLLTKFKKDIDPVKLEMSGELDEFYVSALIAMYKAHLISPKRATEEAQTYSEELIAKIYQGYEDQLQKANRIDKDDVISMAVQVLLDNPETRVKYQSQFEFVLVDEYQEMTVAQDIFARLLAAPQDNLAVAGDEDETTTEYKNACPELLSELSLRFPQARCVLLEKNWRCHPAIVDHARQLIGHLTRRHISKEFTSAWGAAPSQAIVGPQACRDENEEAEWILSEIQALIAAGRKPGEVAVLYHHNYYEALVEDALTRGGIRFKATASPNSLIPDEIGDMIAYLRLVVDPDGPKAREAFERVSQLGTKEIDPKLSATIASFAEANNLSYLKAIEIYAEATADQSCRELEQLVKIIRAMHQDKLPPGDAIGYLRRNRRLNEYYKTIKVPPGISYEPLKKLSQLEEEARKFQSVNEFIKHLEEKKRDEDNNIGQECVEVKSVLDCKGQEYPFVFILGMADGVFPTANSPDVEEERRICYVGFTRARERLYLSYPVRSQDKDHGPSMFLAEARLVPAGGVWAVPQSAQPVQAPVQSQPTPQPAADLQIHKQPPQPQPVVLPAVQVPVQVPPLVQPLPAVAQAAPATSHQPSQAAQPVTAQAANPAATTPQQRQTGSYPAHPPEQPVSQPAAQHTPAQQIQTGRHPVHPQGQPAAQHTPVQQTQTGRHPAHPQGQPAAQHTPVQQIQTGQHPVHPQGQPAAQHTPVQQIQTGQHPAHPQGQPAAQPTPAQQIQTGQHPAHPQGQPAAQHNPLQQRPAINQSAAPAAEPADQTFQPGPSAAQPYAVPTEQGSNSQPAQPASTTDWSKVDYLSRPMHQPQPQPQPQSSRPQNSEDLGTSRLQPYGPGTQDNNAKPGQKLPPSMGQDALQQDDFAIPQGQASPPGNAAVFRAEELDYMYRQPSAQQVPSVSEPEADGGTVPCCPSCSEPLEGGSRFCGNCGYSLPERIPICSSCQSALEPQAKFCGECGIPVKSETSAGPQEEGWANKFRKFLND